jgi:4-hydroxybenzoate polyprenyltransferase
MDDLKAEDIIAIILLSGSFIALYLGKASWEQILSIITLIAGVYFGIGIGYKRASQKEGEKVV